MDASEAPLHPPAVPAAERMAAYRAVLIASLLLLAMFSVALPSTPDGADLFRTWLIFGTFALPAAFGIFRTARSRVGKSVGALLVVALGCAYAEIVAIPGAQMAYHVLRYHLMA